MAKPRRSNILSFKDGATFRAWLAKHGARVDEIWIRFFKKASGRATITYHEALDEALCFGWIDGLVNSYDTISWIHRFTPRRPKSGWSKLNRKRVARLIREKRMRPSGLREVQSAKRDGRWKEAYDSPAHAKPPPDFLRALAKNKKARVHFETLNRANRYAIFYRLQTAKKPETRAKRLASIVEMLAKGRKIHEG